MPKNQELVCLSRRNSPSQHHRPPTAEWSLQQFREALPEDRPYRFAIYDRESIFSKELDNAVAELGMRVLRTPVRAPHANSVCERFGGTRRRECLNFVIPLNDRHLKRILEYQNAPPNPRPKTLSGQNSRKKINRFRFRRVNAK